MDETKEPKKQKAPLTKGKRIALLVVICLLAVVLIGGSVFCVVTEQNPVEAVQGVFTSRENAICANWQSQEKPDLVAYVFYEDGTYDSFLSNFNFGGEYKIDGNKLSLHNTNTDKSLVYKFTIYGDVLTLTLLQEDGKDVEEQEVSKFDRVDELNMRSLTDIIGQIQEQHNQTTEEATKK